MHEQQIRLFLLKVRAYVAHGSRGGPLTEPAARRLRVIERPRQLQRRELRLAEERRRTIPVRPGHAEHGGEIDEVLFGGDDVVPGDVMLLGWLAAEHRSMRWQRRARQNRARQQRVAALAHQALQGWRRERPEDRKSTRLNSSH